MSKKRSYKKTPPKRDFKPIANRRLLKAPRLPVLRPIEDFRRNSFPLTRARAYNLITIRPTKPSVRPYKSLYPRVPALSRLAHVLPKEAVVCVRRAQRREVLFALGRGGSRSKQGRHRTNETSKIHCRK